jgi:uncharacterized membrane protein YjgN (DUF898 family)
LAGFATLFLLIPAARRARDYFWVNHHTFGGRRFRTEFSYKRIYAIYLLAFVLFIGVFALTGGAIALLVKFWPHGFDFARGKANPFPPGMIAVWAFAYIAILMIVPVIETMIVNLTLRKTKLDERHQLKSRMNPIVVAWIMVTNAILTLLTIGVYYPWARVRLTRYETRKLSLLVDGDLDAYTTEAFGTQSAVGEEIGSVFAFDFGL